jgi:predicted ATPase
MRLISLNLDGQYKSLKDQFFDFESAQGNVIAFIGLNGSGKSQLLELIGESFAYLERYKRKDFKTYGSLGFSVTLIYQIDIKHAPDIASYADEFFIPSNGEPTLKCTIRLNGEVDVEVRLNNGWFKPRLERNSFPIPHIIGYSSGLNENLQRSFMKNSVQFFDVSKVKYNRRKALSGDINESEVSRINQHFLSRYPRLFSRDDYDENYLSLKESGTTIPSNIYLDYDSSSLLMCAFSTLPDQEIEEVLGMIRFKYPRFIRLKYDLRAGGTSDDSTRDIQRLIEAVGDDAVVGIGEKTSEQDFNIYELDYLSGYINLDLSDHQVKARLREFNYSGPAQLFERLYKLQLLGVGKWQPDIRKKLKSGGFMGTVKKPIKGRLPLVVDRLELADQQDHRVSFDDLSDGESQLINVLAAIRIFRDQQVLFLFDEPDTHLNPSWRTSFFEFISNVTQSHSASCQMFVSTHSPFMISSLKRSNVFQFSRDDRNLISMRLVTQETFGASFDVLIKVLFELRSLISQSVVKEIREQLKQGDEHAKNWIEQNLGASPEKAYLIRKLSK